MSATGQAVPVEEGSDRAPMPFESTGPCWVCGGAARDRVWSDPFDLTSLPRYGPRAHADHPASWLVRCRSCGFAQPESLPAAPDYFDLLYQNAWSPEALDLEFDFGHKDLIFRAVLAGLERRRAPGVPKSVLDVGTHVGRFPFLAQQAGWEAEAIELNPRTAEYAARRTGLPSHQASAEALATSGRRYGAVALTDVLEHIPRPLPLVTDLRRLIVPGGVIAIKVPHGVAQRLKERIRRSLLKKADAGVMTRFVHVNHFTVRSLRECLERAGFHKVTIGIGAPELTPASPGRTFAQAQGTRLRMAVYHAGRLLPGGVHTPLSLNLQAFARNPE